MEVGLLRLEGQLVEALSALSFSAPVAFVYNPLVYAAAPHELYVRRFCSGKKKRVVFLGMNPGPFGMCQTGVPFGEVNLVKDWLGIVGEVVSPSPAHPKRPVLGFNCTRSEVSGKRFWGLLRSLTNGDASKFFSNSYVHNYCPLAFMDTKGKNITPPCLKSGELKKLEQVCDGNLKEVLELLGAEVAVCIGKYVETRMKRIVSESELGVDVVSILHPSPINPAANRPPGWEQIVTKQLADSNLLHIILSD